MTVKDMITNRKQPRTRPPNLGDRSAAGHVIARMTAGRETGSLRIDWSRLTVDEQFELVGLGNRLHVKGGGFDVGALDRKELRRFEGLIEKGAGLDPGHFQCEKEEIAMRKQIEELAAKARRPAPKPATLLPGSVVLGPELGEDLRAGVLWTSHLTLIAALEFQFQSARAWTPQATFEGEGDGLALCFDSRFSPFGRAGGEDGGIPNWKLVLSELEERNWFEVERHGRDWKIRRGQNALALGRSSA